jgi:P27 family predicted phage terminase small subunit
VVANPCLLRCELHGNPRKVALPKFEPKPDGDLKDAPSWFNDEQRLCWSYAMASAPPGMLKRIDRGALVAWVVAEDLHRQAAIAQGKVGLLVRIKTRATIGADDPGVPAASPYINIINQQAKIMLKAASELGFTPVSRPRVNAGAGLDFSAAEREMERETADTKYQSIDEYLAAAPKRHPMN